MHVTHKPLIAVLAISMLILAACNLPINPSATQVGPNLIYTAAAQTVAAQLTQSAANVPDPTVQPPTPSAPTQPPAPQPTEAPTTAAPTTAPVGPTNTPLPPTSTPVPCNRLEFLEDVNVPDGTEFNPDDTFDKTWKIKNVGSCTWTSSYSLVFDRGDSMGAPASVQLTTGTVAPGSTIEATIKDLEAPTNPGTYQGYWKLRDGSGQVFGYGESSKAFWVKIVVVTPVNYDFLANAADAEWHNATEDLAFGDRDSDAPGVAAYGRNVKLENGKTYEKVLGTYPERIDDGIIYGIFDSYKVVDGDHFRAEVGFRADCSGGKVLFQLKYMKGGVITLLKEWKKTCDGSLLSIDYDLSDMEGETVQFILSVDANGTYKNDKAIWVDPRIQK